MTQIAFLWCKNGVTLGSRNGLGWVGWLSPSARRSDFSTSVSVLVPVHKNRPLGRSLIFVNSQPPSPHGLELVAKTSFNVTKRCLALAWNATKTRARHGRAQTSPPPRWIGRTRPRAFVRLCVFAMFYLSSHGPGPLRSARPHGPVSRLIAICTPRVRRRDEDFCVWPTPARKARPGAPSGGVSRRTGGRGTMARGSADMGPRDAHQKCACKPSQFASKRSCCLRY